MMFFYIIRYINLINYSRYWVISFSYFFSGLVKCFIAKGCWNLRLFLIPISYDLFYLQKYKSWVSGALFLSLLNVFLANFQPPFLNWAKNFGPTFFLHCVDVILYSFHTHTYCPYFFTIDKNHKILDKFDLAIGLNIDKFLLKF